MLTLEVKLLGSTTQQRLCRMKVKVNSWSCKSTLQTE